MIARHPVDAGDDARGRAAAAAAQYAHRDERDALGDAIDRAAYRARDVGPVPVAVVCRTAIHGVEATRDTPRELRVVEADAGVDDVGRYAVTRAHVGECRAEREHALVDAVEAPGGAGLRPDRPHHLVLLDVSDVRVARERGRRLSGERSREAFDCGAVRV